MNELTGTLRGIWTDLRQGKDVELYITVPLATVVIVTNLSGQASTKVTTSVTLALLTLLVVALLKLRKQGDRLMAAVEQLEQSDHLADRIFRSEHDIEEVKNLIKGSRSELWLWGSVLADHIGVLATYLERAAIRGVKIKILLIKPTPSAVMTMAAMRAGHPDDSALLFELNANLFRLRQVASRINNHSSQPRPDSFEVRVIDYLAPYVLYAYDPDLPTGRLDLRIAGLQVEVDSRPTFTLTATNAERWYQHFKEQFQAAWSLAEEPLAIPQ